MALPALLPRRVGASSHDLGVLDRLQYRLLRKLAPGEPSHLDGSAYAGKSKLAIQLGQDVLRQLRSCEVVIDFGCGTGSEAIELARLGCRRVIGVDIQERWLRIARQQAEAAGVAVEFVTAAPAAAADAIVSIDGFEHFDDPQRVLEDMRSVLRPGGRVYIAFGPTWYHPLGGHLFSVFPWSHLLFSEAAQCAWRAHFRSDGARHFGEVEGGLNRMTVARFEALAPRAGFEVERLECVPIRRLESLHNRLTREFTTAVVRATLRRTA